MSDIVERLRLWAISTDAVPASDLMDEAADEIERLRSRPCPYVNGTVTQYCTLTPLALTDAEREFLQDLHAAYEDAEREFLQDLRAAYEELANQTGDVNAAAQKEAREHAATLRGLLERTK